MVAYSKTTLIAQMNELYITWRKDFLQQFPNTYITQKYTLTDKVVARHLDFKQTIGIRLGSQGLTKFQTWDIDFDGEPEKAKAVTVNLATALHEYWGIPLEDIHIDFSGSKGYHVTLFYDKVVQDTTLYPFYKAVIDYIGESERNVEFRCSSKYGMKLPLGINQKSKKFMCFCAFDYTSQTLEHMDQQASYEYFSAIERINFAEFKELILDDLKDDEAKSKPAMLEQPTAEAFETVMSEINIDGKSIADLESELKMVIRNQRLTFEHSRNRITFLLSIFFKEQGYELEEAISLVGQIMTNTYDNYRALISADTTREYMLSEINRICKSTFEKDYSLSTRRKDIKLSEWEIKAMLDIKKYHLKKLMFSLLIHSKRYAKADGVFYMAYSTMQKMGSTDNRTRALSYLKELEDMGLIRIEANNVIDVVQSKVYGKAISKPNKYKVLLSSSEQLDCREITLKHNEDMTLEQVSALLIDQKEARKKLPKGQWDAHFREAYL